MNVENANFKNIKKYKKNNQNDSIQLIEKIFLNVKIWKGIVKKIPYFGIILKKGRWCSKKRWKELYEIVNFQEKRRGEI